MFPASGASRRQVLGMSESFIAYSVQRGQERTGEDRREDRIGVAKLKDEREHWIGGRGSSMCTVHLPHVFCLLSSVFLAKRVLHAGGRPSERPSVRPSIVDRESWIACFAYITRISPRESWGNWNARRSVTVTQCASQLRRLDSTRLDRLHGAELDPEPGTDELKLKS